MKKNFKLTIEYDGTRFHGWQIQKADPTIQAAIEKALATITGQPVRLNGAGRTDAGVHAVGQVANFHSETRLGAGELHRGLNSLLPPDIVIRACHVVNAAFHARFDARGKLYRYRIFNQPVPNAIGRQYEWFIRHPLDASAMRAALNQFVGRHDFSAFEGAGSPRAHSIRTVTAADLSVGPQGRLEITIAADGFLRYMVRNLVGTAVAVGSGKSAVSDVSGILASGDRSQAAPTAPPHGLCLVEVTY
jgi:tRNA pseudouridine38-40 synthase